MKKVFGFLLILFSLASCQLWNSDDDKTGAPDPAPTDNRATVGFNFTMSAFQQQVLSDSVNNTKQRSAQAFTTDQVLTGELVATNKTTHRTKNYSWSIYLNQNDLSVQSNKTVVLNVAEYDFQLTLTKGNQQYIGTVSGYNIVDGTNDVSMVIKPVIGDTITDVTLLDNVGTIQFQYSKTELTKFTAPKLGIAIDGGAETIYAIDPAIGLISNHFNLSEGVHNVVLKFYEGDTQLAKSNPAQETFNVTLGNNITMDLIPLEGETSFTLTENGGNAKFKLNLPTALITEAGSKENLEAQMTITGPKNTIREVTLSVSSTIDATGDTVYLAETTLDTYHYDTVSYTVIFSDLSKTPKEELARCTQENVTLTKDGNTTPCSITMKRGAIATGNLYGTLAVNVFNVSNEPLPGVKIKANDQLIGITGTGIFGSSGYLKHRIIKGNYKIKAEDIGTVEQDVTIDALELKNIDLVLSQNLTWKFVDGDGENGINKNPLQKAYRPQLTVFNNKLYTTWSESNGTADQIRVAVYGGDDSSPSWKFLDGDGVNGINKNSAYKGYASQLTVFDNKLYATWAESNGIVNQIRMAVYNGDDSAPEWKFIDGDGANGINKNQEQPAFAPQLTTFNNKLYATWYESNGSLSQIRMAVYNGNDSTPEWKFIDGNGTNGVNKNSNLPASVPRLIVFNNKLYATWTEYMGTTFWYSIAVYNGNDSAPEWNFIDGNADGHGNEQLGIAVDLMVFNNKLYATWSKDEGAVKQIRVAVYNSEDSSPAWKLVDSNSAGSLGPNGSLPQLTVFDNRLYLIARNRDDEKKDWIRVAVYNGDDASPYWRAANGVDQKAINRSPERALHPQLTVFNHKLYATWPESNGIAWQIRMAVASYQ